MLTDGWWRPYRDTFDSAPAWTLLVVVNLWHSQAIQAGSDPVAGPHSFGDDEIAGGPGSDTIFGQLGDDVIQGDGTLAGVEVGAHRTAASDGGVGELVVIPSFEALSDGDDYVEGGGGDDVIFGNLGQDDLIGGSSNLFTLIGQGAASRRRRLDLRRRGHPHRPQPLRRRALRAHVMPPTPTRSSATTATSSGSSAATGSTPWAPARVPELQLRRQRPGQPTGYGPLAIVVRGVHLLDHTAGGPSFAPGLFGDRAGGRLWL